MYGPEVETAIYLHARSVYPEECCGLVLNDGTYVALENMATDKLVNFKISDEDYLKYENRIIAVVHSHPKGPDHPTRIDMVNQVTSNVPWGICTVFEDMRYSLFWYGDQCPIPPLVGRVFRPGVTDCWSAVRDWFRLNQGILIDDCPREDSWWTLGEDYYEQGYFKRGFREVQIEKISDLRAGDGFLAKIRSPVYNHGGLYIGNGLIYHHLVNRMSREEPIYRWWGKHSVKWLRRTDG